jgi:hypothetical protein
VGEFEGQPEDHKPDLKGQVDRWRTEFASARKERERFERQGRKVVEKFLDERPDSENKDMKWPLFYSNVVQQQCILFGRTPGVDVTRRHADADDDLSRVGSEIHQRVLNTDIERDDDTFAQAAQYALSDWLLPGFGMIKFRYVCELDPETHAKTFEDVETDYVPWEDVLWSPCKVYHLSRWWAFKSLMGRKALKKRWPKDFDRIPLNHGKKDGEPSHPWDQAEVWEIWDKENKERVFYVEGYDHVLEIEKDQLNLNGFWPFPRPLMSNLTTSKMMPKPDYAIAQDMYEEVNLLCTRAKLLEQAIRVTGGYDSECTGLQSILEDSNENKLYPIENWGDLMAKGGLKGVIEWLPLEPVVLALGIIQQRIDRVIEAIHQITGMADIMRGQAQTGGATAHEQAIKARFGSVRIQSKQDEFARFCSEGQRIRGEMIVRMFDPENIVARANVDSMIQSDQQLVPQAIEMLKSTYRDFKIEVKPESVSLTDFAALKSERMEVMTAISGYLSMAGGVAQQMPQAAPFMFEILKVLVAGLKGSNPIEAILDQAVKMAKQALENPQPQQENPKIAEEKMKQQTAQMKQQADLQSIQAKTQAKLVEIGAESQAKAMMERVQRMENTQEARDKAVIAQATRPEPTSQPKGPKR